MREVDVVVIGAGPAGENAADLAIRGSDRTALLVEDHLVGGECSYYACMPSKALLRPLDVAAAADHLEGIEVSGPDVDGLLRRRDTWVSHYDDAGQVRWAESANIEVARGRGALAGDRVVEITAADGTTEQVRARLAVVLATGSVPIVPPGLDGIGAWGSRDATGVVEVPARLAIVGGGVIACEAARWMAALGSQVTMLVRGDRLLPRAESFASEAVLTGLREAGIDVRFGVSVESADRPDVADSGLGRVHGGPVTLRLGDGSTLEADELLVATGRRPDTASIGLDTVGLTPDDLRGRTHGGPLPEWLFAVGDVSGQAPLTHWGKYQARQIGALIAARAEGRTPPQAPDDVPVPQVVFTDPQVTWVGMTSDEAEAAGREVRLLDADYTSAAGAALLRDDASGHCRLVVDAQTDVLVGATFVGPDTAELLHSATVAIVGRVPLDVLRHAVPSYPTASEVWLRLLG